MEQLRKLTEKDRTALEAFLVQHTETSMFLRSNLRVASIDYSGHRYEAVYVGKLIDGCIVGVVAHAWNNCLLVQAPEDAPELACKAAESSNRPVSGLLGPVEQVSIAIVGLGMSSITPMTHSHDDLYSLDLAKMVVPPLLQTGQVRARLSEKEDLPLLVEWRVEYCAEALGATIDQSLREEVTDTIEQLHRERNLWLLEENGVPVAKTAISARLPDCVQVGGVWTPPQFRGRGFARSVVAASLLKERSRGAGRAILFTDTPDARRAYESIGFQRIGSFGMVLYKEHQPLQVATSSGTASS